MDKKHIFLICVDAMCLQHHGANNHRNSTTPFLDKMAKEGLFCERMYAQGPYSEASLAGILGGERTLAHGTYFQSIENVKHTLFELLGKIGYNTYSLLFPYVNSSSYVRGCETCWYDRGVTFNALVDYRGKHVSKLLEEGKCTNEEINAFAKLLQDHLFHLENIVEGVLKKSESTVLIRDYINMTEGELKEYLREINEQQYELGRAPEAYTKQFLRNLDRPFNGLKELKLTISDDSAKIEWIQQHWKPLMEKAEKLEHEYNKRNKHVDIAYLLCLALEDELGLRAAVRCNRAYKAAKNSSRLTECIQGEIIQKKPVIRAASVFDKVINVSKKLDKPSFFYLHVEDFHTPTMPYSSQHLENRNLKREYKQAEEYINSLPENYQGDLRSDLGALYMDSCIEEFISGLPDTVKENAVFIVTADHGNPFYNCPPRQEGVNTFYEENLHIPFYMWGKDIEPRHLHGIYNTSDIMPTILHYIGEDDLYHSIKEELRTETVSMSEEQGRKFTIAEYMGPGCPDIYRNPIYYSIIGENYKVNCKVLLSDSITTSQIIEVYNLKKDPEEKYNLRHWYMHKNEVKELITKLRERHSSNQSFYLSETHL